MIKLAPRQKEALENKAKGLTIAEIAIAMECSVNNVNALLRECYFKLMARGATDAVAKAMQKGLIQFVIVVSVFSCMADKHTYREPKRSKSTPRMIEFNRSRMEISA